AGTTLDFAIADANGVGSATWNNSSGANALSSPYDVSTAGWTDGARDVTVIAVDNAGNSRTAAFHFTFDTTPPTVTLTSPAHHPDRPPGHAARLQRARPQRPRPRHLERRGGPRDPVGALRHQHDRMARRDLHRRDPGQRHRRQPAQPDVPVHDRRDASGHQP